MGVRECVVGTSESQLLWPLHTSHGNRVLALVDTGAEVSLLHRGALGTSPVQACRSQRQLVTAAGDAMATLGTAELRAAVGNGFCGVEATVVRALAVDAILGMDFLRQHVRTLDLDAGQAVLRTGGKVNLLAKRRSAPLRAAAAAVVAPRTADWVPCDGASGVYEATDDWGENLPDVFIPSAHGVYVTNTGDTPLQVDKGAVLGTPAVSCCLVLPGTQGEAEETKGPAPTVGDGVSPGGQAAIRTLLQKHRRLFTRKLKAGGNPALPPFEVETWGEPLRQRARRLSPQEAALVDSEVEKMLDLGVVRPSVSPWAAPVVLVRKKNGEVRFCIDFRALNRRTKPDTYPLPRTDAILESMAGSRVFSCLDLSKGYWQVPMAAASREKTAFATPRGLFEFVVVPFGLTNAPSMFQRTMDRILGDVLGEHCAVFLDDIIVHAPDEEAHLAVLSQVLERLDRAGLIVNAKKSVFATRVSPFLGHVLSEEGVCVDKSKVEAMIAMPRWTCPRSGGSWAWPTTTTTPSLWRDTRTWRHRCMR